MSVGPHVISWQWCQGDQWQWGPVRWFIGLSLGHVAAEIMQENALRLTLICSLVSQAENSLHPRFQTFISLIFLTCCSMCTLCAECLVCNVYSVYCVNCAWYVLYDMCGVILYVSLVCIVCVCVVSSVGVYFPDCIQCSVLGREESGGFFSRHAQWSLHTLGVVPRQKRTRELQESNYTQHLPKCST